MTPRSGNIQRMSGNIKPVLRGCTLNVSMALATVGGIEAPQSFKLFWCQRFGHEYSPF